MPPIDAACLFEEHEPNAQTVNESKALTPNQKKKRRHKLAKLGAQKVVSTNKSDSCVSDSTFEPAASQASTTAFAILHPSNLLSSRASVAGLAADLMASVTSELSTDVAPSASTAESDIGTALPKTTQPAASVLHNKKATPTVSNSAWSEAAASCASGHGAMQRQQHPITAPHLPERTPAQLATPAPEPDQAALPSSCHSGLICRRDMSAAALAVHASFVPQNVHSSTVSPPITDAQEAEPSTKRQKRVFLHGNYNRYYGYRLGSELEEDPRLQVLDRRWFHGKRCLDIGCNEGVITLAAVQRFAPLSMLGVDIDGGLIKTACRALSKQRTEASNLHQRLTRHMTSAEVGDRPAAQRKAAAAAVRAFANVWFTCEDFASSAHTPQSLDTIMCLSVTKWVHLNQGDEGLKRLFVKVKESLVPGGWFVLEPQPWRSYQQARRKQDMSAAPFARLDMLQLRPEAFPDYLEQELGFVLARELHVATSSAGFNRPMYLFQRGM